MNTNRKPKLIIFEGIATSGKTTVIKILITHLKKKSKVVFVSEMTTLAPVFENKDSMVAVDFLSRIVKKIEKISADYVVVERLFLSHAFRTKSQLQPFTVFEKQLIKIFEPVVILLQMKNKCITNRITLADNQRTSWKYKKKGTLKERVTYYKEQQKYLRKLSKQSVFPVILIDTSDMDWLRVFNNVLKSLK